MVKERSAADDGFLRELAQVGLYKRSQGRIARQATFAAMAVVFALGAYRMYETLPVVLEARGSLAALWSSLHWALPAVTLFGGVWLSYRLVNYPRFADFLIAVEAEMNKVSWPTRTELIRSSIVVIVVMIFLAIVLFGYDMAWTWIFNTLGFTKA